MNRYVIVCILKDEILAFHEELVKQVCLKYDVRPQRLPAHFTIKAPFETDNIMDIEHTIENFVKNHHGEKIMTIDGFDHFRDNVVFMKINASKAAIEMHHSFIDQLRNISWLDFKPHEDKDKVFHCTIVSHLNKENFKDIWLYVNNFHPKFEFFFDNISILTWDKYKWVPYKSYKIK